MEAKTLSPFAHCVSLGALPRPGDASCDSYTSPVRHQCCPNAARYPPLPFPIPCPPLLHAPRRGDSSGNSVRPPSGIRAVRLPRLPLVRGRRRGALPPHMLGTLAGFLPTQFAHNVPQLSWQQKDACWSGSSPLSPPLPQVLGTARRMLAEILSAAEFLDAACMRTVKAQLEGVANPLEGGGQQSEGAQPFYMLIETHGSNEGHDVEKLDAFLEVGLYIQGVCDRGEGCRGALTHGSCEGHDVEKLDAFL